jgi:hypothetical protein
MGLSETIIAAIIGAGATMATAIFQLIRNRTPSEVRPKKNRMRSLFATIALMIGCIVGGYAWSSLRAVSATEEMRTTLQSEFTRQFATLGAHQADEHIPPVGAASGEKTLTASRSTLGSTESLAQLPPCTPAAPAGEATAASCTEQDTQTVTLCAALPSTVKSTRMQIMARPQKPDSVWQKGEANAATIGDLHVVDAPTEQPLSATERSACLSVANWSTQETLMVRLLVEYAVEPAPIVPAAAAITASLQ